MKQSAPVIRKLAVLTGATGGIGREIVSGLIAQGYHVVALARGTATNSGEFGPNFTQIACDFSQTDLLPDVASQIGAFAPSIAALIHCAGSIIPETVENIADDHLATQLAVNLSGPILLTSCLLPMMPRGSHIVFVNSMAGVLPLAGSSVYSACKFGLRGFARALALEVRGRGIAVSSVFPGAVDTAMLRAEMSAGGSPLNFVSQPAMPADIAKVVVAACSGRGREAFRPSIDGLFAHLCLMMPGLLRLTMPLLLILGKRGHARFLAKQV